MADVICLAKNLFTITSFVSMQCVIIFTVSQGKNVIFSKAVITATHYVNVVVSRASGLLY